MRLCRNRFKHRDTELQSSLFYSYSTNILSGFVSSCFIFCVLIHLRVFRKFVWRGWRYLEEVLKSPQTFGL